MSPIRQPTRLRPSLAAGLTLGLSALVAVTGCNACAKQPEAAKAAATPKKDDGGSGEVLRPPKPPPEPFVLTGNMLALDLGAKVWVWADGRTSGISGAPGTVSWGEGLGFVLQDKAGVRVLGAGGGLFHLPKAPDAGLKPLAEFLATAGAAPDRFVLEAKENKPGSFIINLEGPSERHVRIGRANAAPAAVSWATLPLPEGLIATPPLALTDGFGPDELGEIKNAAPEGATVVPDEAPAASLAAWLKEVQAFAGPKANTSFSRVLDLDGDEHKEAFVCYAGATDGHSCFVIDEVAGQSRYYPVPLPWTSGDAAAAPIAMQKNGRGYVIYSGRGARTSETAKPVLHVVRFDGGGYSFDLVANK